MRMSCHETEGNEEQGGHITEEIMLFYRDDGYDACLE